MPLSAKDRDLHDLACLLCAPVCTAEMHARAEALIARHGFAREDLDAAPARLVAMAQVREGDTVVTVQCDGTVVRDPVRGVEAARGRYVVRFGPRGMSVANGLPAHELLVEPDARR